MPDATSRSKPSVSARAAAVPPAVPPPKRFLVRCTYVGEDKKKRIDGSFRFLAEAADVAVLRPKIEKAVNRLRRTGELPPRCEVYIEFILELADLARGIVADFERWEHDPKRFQHGCITFSDTCPVYQTESAEAAFRFGKSAGNANVPPVNATRTP